jgi:hypothetical protein
MVQEAGSPTLPGVISPFSSASVIMLYPILRKYNNTQNEFQLSDIQVSEGRTQI